MTASLISACNEALAKCSKEHIVSLDEGSIESATCESIYPALLEEMADWAAWPDSVTRANLALLTSNDREAEWLYAYGKPNDLGDPIAIRAREDAATSLPVGGPYTLPAQDIAPLAYIIEGGVIYTNVKDAILVYARRATSIGQFTSHMRRAFVDELAYRLSYPFRLDRGTKADLRQEAEMSRARAIAEAENSTPRQRPNHVSEAEWARMGYLR
jgi:hypothetical protein